MHRSVGAIIRKGNQILMLDRKKFPFGWACPAGHIDEGESPEQAIEREIKEETGLDIKNFRPLIHEFVEWNECSKGKRGHDWYVFEADDFEGELKMNEAEEKNLAWKTTEEIRGAELEEVWQYWFKKLKII